MQTEYSLRATPTTRNGIGARRAESRTRRCAQHASYFLAAVFLFGTTAPTLAEEDRDYFGIPNSPDPIKPSKHVAYFPRARDLDIMQPAKYRGIEKYTAELNDQYRPELDQVRRMPANGEIASVPGRNIGSVLAYSFHRNGARYQGQLQYRSSDEINDKLAFLHDLAK
ncbi:hypothetical protein [Burkholderia sp. JKS000303]|uniref:hypothetical protein n=1 Tax=Burkholderia sp. JKS000303 TaxID=1938747 RepID=UPI000C017AC6|nr:hypothetical protein [Burkholderia sp. JKS000303]PFH26446.1 hypothetical protein BX604_0140 [Burkholderia sp. JKS000303]